MREGRGEDTGNASGRQGPSHVRVGHAALWGDGADGTGV